MKRQLKKSAYFLMLLALGWVLVYPLLWLLFSSFKSDNADIFGSLNLLPKVWTLDGYLGGWTGSGQLSFGVFFVNTVAMVLPTVFFTMVSSTLVAYGFARFDFPLRKPLFAIMIATLMLPGAVLLIPRYILFTNFGWINSYLPFIVPAAFATSSFFIFLMVQFLRGIPVELDESAKIDGANSWTILWKILGPLSKPALFSVGIFQFMWTWNDFFNAMIYINSTEKFTLPLALRMALDTSSGVAWNQVLAMSVVTILPCVIIFFVAQKYFVEGVATTGLKG